MATATPVAHVEPPWTVPVLLAVPLTVLVVLVIATPAARRSSRARIPEALRSE